MLNYSTDLCGICIIQIGPYIICFPKLTLVKLFLAYIGPFVNFSVFLVEKNPTWLLDQFRMEKHLRDVI